MKKHKTLRQNLIFKTLLFFAAVFSIAFVYNNVVVTIILLIILFLGIGFKRRKYDILFFVGGAIAGSFGEIICTNFQCWTYTNPTFMNIPLWIPFAWGIMTVLIKRTTENLPRQTNT